MKALPALLVMLALAVASVSSLAQKPIGGPSNLPSDDAQNNTPPPPAPAQPQAPNAGPQTEAAPPTIEDTVEAAEPLPRRNLVRWNEYHGPHFTIRVGAGFLYDFSAFAQDRQSKEQIAISPGEKVRDFRLIMGGKFPSIPLPTTWCAGFMYDGVTGSWFLRQTGIMVGVPKILSYFFLGRQKEGFSLNKIMVGYDGWTMERSTMNDTIPLLADGLKWYGYSKRHGFLWNVGYYNDVASKGQSFSTYSSQEVARLGWLPVHSEEKGTLIHVAFNFRYGKPVDGKLRLKSKPEAFLAPLFLDTGTFPANSANNVGYEAYYRKKSLLLGSEYYYLNSYSKSGDHSFHGGDFVATWLVTGETRPYNAVKGAFNDIAPLKPVFSGGPGAWELLLRYSYTNLNSHNSVGGPNVQGGTFARITPMANWYLSENVRLEMAYGYGKLDRFDLKGGTQFFQSRIQLQF